MHWGMQPFFICTTLQCSKCSIGALQNLSIKWYLFWCYSKKITCSINGRTKLTLKDLSHKFSLIRGQHHISQHKLTAGRIMYQKLWNIILQGHRAEIVLNVSNTYSKTESERKNWGGMRQKTCPDINTLLASKH